MRGKVEDRPARTGQALAVYVAGLLLFGSNGVVASHIALSSHEIVFLRTVLGFLTILALFVVTRRRWTAFGYPKEIFYVALSGAAMAADWLFLFEGFTRLGVSLTVIINYTGPVMVVAYCALVRHEHVSLRKGLCLLAAFGGAILISGNAAVSGVDGWGIACAVLSAVSYAVMVLLNRRAVHITGMENSLFQIFFAFVTVAVFLVAKQGVHLQIAAVDVPWILWLGVLNTGVGCFCYFSSIGALPVQTVAVFGYMEPVSGVVFSVLFLHEALLPLQILGIALILGGAIVGELEAQT